MGDTNAGGSRGGRFFGVATSGTTYAALFYLLVSFPLAVASWSALITLLAAGGGLAVTIVGVPMLVLTMFAWCYYADLERLLSNTLLRTNIRPLPFGHEQEARGIWARIKLRLKNAYTWRSLAYLLVPRFAMGIAGLTVACFTVGMVAQLLLTPIDVAAGWDNQIILWTPNDALDAVLGPVLAVFLFIPSLHLIRWSGWLAGRVNILFLQSPETSVAQPHGDALDRAARAAANWSGVFTAQVTEGARRERSIQLRVWTAHFALYLATMVVLLVINGLATPDSWWVLWPAWGWGIALALHTGYLLQGHLGGHALAFAVTNIGFFVIDAEFAESTWFFWPLVAWAIALAAHFYIYFGFAPIKPAELLIEGEGGFLAFAAAPPPPPPPGIDVDRSMRTVRAAGERVEVTPKEFDLLVLLTGEPGKPFSREELLEHIWKDDYEVTDRTVDTHMQRLRKKLGDRADCIQTVWGVGYRYQP